MVENRLEMTPQYSQRIRLYIALACCAMLIVVLLGEFSSSRMVSEFGNVAGQKAQHLLTGSDVILMHLLQMKYVLLSILLPIIALAGFYFVHRLLNRLYGTYERSHVILQSIGDTVVVTDGGGLVEYLNRPAQKLMGWSQQEVQGKPLAEIFHLLHANTREPVLGPVETVLRGGKVNAQDGHAVLLSHDGRELMIEDSAAPVRDEQGNINGVVMVFRDITAQKAAQSQIAQLVYHDHLTGLPNRRLLQDRVEKAISSAERRRDRMALLLVDLDHFKVINDTLGHELGDLLLTIAGGRLLTCIRDQDTLARTGGDEFVVMLADIREASDAAVAAQKILEVLSVPYHVDDTELHSTPSIGISLYPEDGEDFVMLMKHADTAMYHTKESGRASYRFYTEEMNVRTLERLTVENNLHKALEKGEFDLHYQPKVNMREGTLVGAEALIRWNHPELGMISPAKFIPIAEESSMINAIGEWVLYSASRQSRIWSDEGLLSLPVSVNVSARQLLYGDLPQMLAQIIRETRALPSMMELELTEGVLMHPQEVEEVLAACKGMGFNVSLDDFGTGYSSLSYLRRMAIDTLKIDRSFVSDLENNPDDVAIVQTIISMARNLRMNVIAEGVETRAQVEVLIRSGCDYCQGYYFSRPQPLAQFSALLCRSARRAHNAAALYAAEPAVPRVEHHQSPTRRHRYLI
jgi:diguanylate cyclase (GGDEF)-like protein/PAS domain S-box-containing protein